jgi:hypothetical protein
MVVTGTRDALLTVSAGSSAVFAREVRDVARLRLVLLAGRTGRKGRMNATMVYHMVPSMLLALGMFWYVARSLCS